MPMWLSR